MWLEHVFGIFWSAQWLAMGIYKRAMFLDFFVDIYSSDGIYNVFRAAYQSAPV